ncbi:DegT/DnrJ/EryC1/StrS family aminotransferase [Aquimarina brevivitae]|uniref:dTDP-4-amino-4,6-dideoxygalactose transaminase n=1 Tax=Aquimarina brevivitae TaxID=323412 RepID=A0A4Q7NX13_9FLAO|nr:DegT/DnrJ/EryC1/StrS family aminotransferase [Aquimarina brevivitae]RZS91891.1 dTDP-4-amino-4,6-dideoxygalactose transaminase [Aquimarina brevivitae]
MSNHDRYIPFLDLKEINKTYEAQLAAVLANVAQSGTYINGPRVAHFESAFASYCGVTHCVGVGNGHDALLLILKGYIALGRLRKGDKVIVAANTFIATILAVLNADLIPVFVEPEEKTFNLNAAAIASKLTTEVRAILVTHLYGQLAPMEEIRELAETHDVLVIADAAQAHGAMKHAKKAGNLSNAAAFSFYPTKNLGCLGDGGAVTTNDTKLASIVRQLGNYGSVTKYNTELLGVNSRLDEIQAAILIEKLKYLDEENERRRTIAKRYLYEITNPKLQLPYWDGSANHVFHLFVVRTANRAALLKHLDSNGIGHGLHYPKPPHQQKGLEAYKDLELPLTERMHNEVVSIPLHPCLEDTEVDRIITILNSF